MRLRWFGGAGASGALMFLAALVALHLLRTDLSPVADYVSDYANGPYGGLFTSTAIVHGAGNLTMAYGLWHAVARSRAGRWGVVLLAVAALGMVVGGAFPTDPPGATSTTVGLIHRVAATVAFPVELVAVGVLVEVFRLRPQWREHARWTRAASVLAAVSLAWFVGALAFGWAPGLPERVTLGVFLGWELATGVRLLSVGRPAARRLESSWPTRSSGQARARLPRTGPGSVHGRTRPQSSPCTWVRLDATHETERQGTGVQSDDVSTYR